MGSSVISGSAVAVAVTTGDTTLFGTMAKNISEESVETSFSKGVNSVSWVLIRFMFVMIPVVFVINGITKGDWLQAFLFAISIAVGLTPEMLPMIVTTCLAKGAVSMSRKKTIVKNLNSIQNFGAIDILCTDKTGTLTQDKVILSYFCKPQGISITEDLQNVRPSEQVNNRVSLETLCLGKTRYSSVLPKQEYHWNTDGTEDTRILRHAYLNSYFQTGYKNVMDLAIIHKTEEEENSES